MPNLRSPKRGFFSVLITMGLLWLWTIQTGLFAQSDTIVLANEDRIIGEIKSMSKGILVIEPEYSETDFQVTWTEVIAIYSGEHFLISMTDGERYSGQIRSMPGDAAGTVRLVSKREDHTREISDIVFLKHFRQSLGSRFDASISLGYNFTKSNRLRQFTIRSTLNYTGAVWEFTGAFNQIRSSQEDLDVTSRLDATLGGKYLLRNRWFLSLTTDFLSNDEQELKLRVATRGLVGRYFIQSNQVYLGGGAGLALNRERFSDSLNTRRNSLEGVLGVELNLFDIKDFKLFSNLLYYPSLSQSDRYRIDFKLDLKYDLPLDFFIKLGYTQNYDSQPFEGASKDDYVFQATFGWEL